MARIAGINIPKEKKVKISLTYVYGIGTNIVKEILLKANVDGEKRVHELSEKEIDTIQKVVQEYKVEGELRRSIREDIQRLSKVGSYRGVRHKRGLPLRGQKTKTNARTRKGKRRAVSKGKR
jgi:small subunit ribosomal protein S13